MAAQQGSFKINVGVVNDDAIKKLRQINAQMAKAQAPMKAYQREMKRFNDLSGRTANLKKFQNGLAGLKTKFGQVSGAISSVAKPMLALFGIASIAGVVALTRSFANWGNEIRNASALLDLTKNKTIQLQQMGKLTGTNQESQEQTYQDIQTSTQYGNAQAQQADNILGIKKGMSLEDAQIQASRVIHERLKNGTINATGARNLAQMSGVGDLAITRTPEELEKLQRTARANAAEMSRFAGAAAKLNDTFAEASSRVDVLKTRLAAALAPVITPLLQKFIDWSKDNKAVTETMDKITAATQRVGAWIQKIDVTKIQKGFATAIKVGEVLLGVFAAIQAIKLTSWAVSLAADIAKVAEALGGLSSAATVVESGALATAAGVVGTAAVVGGAAAAAGYGVYKGVSEVHHDFFTKEGIDEGNKAKMKDPYYGSNRYTSQEKNDKQYQAMDYLVKQKGYTQEQAASTVAMARQESGFNTLAIGDGGSASGMFQWHKDRREAIEKHFGKSLSKMNQNEQLDAYDWEMHNSEKTAGKELFGAKNLTQAVVGGLDYERPGEWNAAKKAGRAGQSRELATRTQMAMNALHGYSGLPMSSINPNQPIQLQTHVIIDDGRKPVVKTRLQNPNIADLKTTVKGGIHHG